MTAGVTPGLRALLGRLKAYKVEWKFSFIPSENVEYEPGTDREVADLADANVISSELKTGMHILSIDCDYPVYVVPSSDPTHSHVYFDLPRPLANSALKEILEVLAKHDVIEPGYAEVSIKRGHTDLRLPWVHKSDQKLAEKNPESPARPGETISPRGPVDFDSDPF